MILWVFISFGKDACYLTYLGARDLCASLQNNGRYPILDMISKGQRPLKCITFAFTGILRTSGAGPEREFKASKGLIMPTLSKSIVRRNKYLGLKFGNISQYCRSTVGSLEKFDGQ